MAMRGLGTDLLHSLRLMRRSPGFTTIAVLTIAVGVGASTAVFGLLHALLLRPLPYTDPDRLVVPALSHARNGGQPEAIGVWSYPKFQTFLAEQDVFESVAGLRDLEVNLTGGATPERLHGELATSAYFRVLDVRPALGRFFGAEADTAEGAAVIVLGHRLWQQRFGGEAGILGRALQVDGQSLTVIGVAPPGFRGLTGGADAWAPLALAPRFLHPKMLEMRWAHWFESVGRLRPGVTLPAAIARMAALGAVVDAAHPPTSSVDRWSATARSLVETRQDPKLRTSVLVLFGAVALVLLMGCVNVAHLLLARATARRNEIAVRAALGATRGRLVRQLLTESLLLGVIGGLLGLALASWGLDLLGALRPEAVDGTGLTAAELTDLDALSLSLAIAAFALGISLLAGVIFGAVPAASASRVDLAARIQESSTTHATPLRRRGLFAAVELSLALVLLVGAGLLVRTLQRVTSVDLGFRPEGVLAFQIDPVRPGPEQAWPGREELVERLAALPGVEAAGFDICAPPQGRCDGTIVVQIEGQEKFAEGTEPEIGVHYLAPDTLRALGVPLLAGRGFTRVDRDGAPRVMLLNETAAKKLFPAGDAIGRRLHAAWGEAGMVEIVGIVGDTRYAGPMEPAGAAMYLPFLQTQHSSGFYFVRSSAPTATVVAGARRALAELDADVPMYGVRTMSDVARDATARPRFAAQLLGGFAVVALLLAALGVYGVMAQSVAQRRREIGIRMALGARGRAVLWMMVSQGALIALAGVAVGLVLAFAASRVLAGLVYGVSVTDVATYAAVASLLFTVAVAACLVAARRAVTVDPAETLRDV